MKRLFLLRHGEVSSHRGDVPVTEEGLVFATKVGRNLGRTETSIRILSGETNRTRQTAAAIADGAKSVGASVLGPSTSFALRNPDLYVAGERVDMVSSPGALAAQIPGFSEDDAATVTFFKAFFAASDRIAFWLNHKAPPGENAAAVAKRISDFAASLVEVRTEPALVIAVTHSPLLRACALKHVGQDPGEPNWLSGLRVDLSPDRTVRMAYLAEAP